MADPEPSVDHAILLESGHIPHGYSLEDLIAYQWHGPPDVLGVLHAQHRLRVILKWLAAALVVADRPAVVLDAGCAYGRQLFMLNTYLGKPSDVAFVGVDIQADAIEYAKAFADAIPGFANCSFEVADLTQSLPFSDESFDAVNLADVLEHLESPVDALREIKRVMRRGGALILSTPLRDSIFKRAARAANRVSRGRVYSAYYTGKDADLDEQGMPVMTTFAGLDHVSELSWRELQETLIEAGLELRRSEFMSVMSGSRWFDRHKSLVAGLILLEALHETMRRPSWAHSVVVNVARPL